MYVYVCIYVYIYILRLWNSVPQSHYEDGLLGPVSIVAVYIDPQGYGIFLRRKD